MSGLAFLLAVAGITGALAVALGSMFRLADERDQWQRIAERREAELRAREAHPSVAKVLPLRRPYDWQDGA